MAFDFEKELKEFKKAQRKTYVECRGAGMNEEDTQQVLRWNYEEFCEHIEYMKRTISLDGHMDGDGDFVDECCNPIIFQYPEKFWDDDELDHCLNKYIDWTDERDMRKFRRFIGLLTEKQRRILDLYVDQNMSFLEVAHEMGISKQAVSEQMHFIRKKFQRIFKNYPD